MQFLSVLPAAALAAHGTLLGFNKLEAPGQARTVRVREGRTSVFDGVVDATEQCNGPHSTDS